MKPEAESGSSPSALFHICSRSDWHQAQQRGEYRADSLEAEGFIHCSTQEQVVGAANRFFRGRQGLVLLVIDPRRLQAEVRYEPADGALFPHLYGPLNLDAVTAVNEFSPGDDGIFLTPDLP